MHPITPQECSRIAQDLQIRKVQVESVVQLLDEGNTIPFITRYRKERTGGLHEELIRQIQLRVQFIRQLHDRKQTILKTIANQGKLTDELRQAILAADTTKRLEDLYLPYKPKKRSLAQTARERGLEPLALAIWYSDSAITNLDEFLPGLLNPEKELKTVDDVRAGVGHVLAEMIAESAEVRAPVRSVLWESGQIQAVKSEKLQEGQGAEFKNYFQFKESVRQIPPHRILALNRGEKEHALKVNFEWAREHVGDVALRALSDLLMKRAGQQPPPPPPAPVSAPKTEIVACEPAAPTGDAPPPVETPADAPSVEPSASDAASMPSTEPVVNEVSASEPAHPTDDTPPDCPVPPSEPHPVGGAEAAPLVASLPTSPPLVLTGDPLVPGSEFKSPHAAFIKAALDDALSRLLLPSLEREIRNELTEEAEHHAVQVFARNLRSLLLQPPLRGRRVLAIDPGFRTGCKLAALDEYGNLLDHSVMYPFSSQKKGRGKGEKGDKPKEPAAASPPASATGGAVDVSLAATGEFPHQPGQPEQADEVPVTAPAETPALADTPSPIPETSPAVESVAPVSPSAESESAPPAEAAAPAEPAVPPVEPKVEARSRLIEMLQKHNLQVIALGNGTGCRETEEIIADVIATSAPEVAYIIVNEAGASVYSVSPVGREEFPQFDATTRGTISIGRRLQDPLSELVKVDPQSIGVGLYQHDMGRKELKESLDAVVESCVNQVGVDLNTASVPLLRHVSGLNQLVARELVEYRKTHGAFADRGQLMQVPSFGPARFTQAAGFLKIPAAGNPLDRTWIHPESYDATQKLLAELGYGPGVLDDKAASEEFHAKLRAVHIDDMARKLNIGGPTLADILAALLRPDRDPREDLPPPIFKKGILRLEDLQPGMELRGTVLNVVDFGAFVDIGLKDSGLVHISQMANRYIKSPYDVVAVNDVVTVWVKSIDAATRHVSLTMIKPGTEQKPPERGARGPRPEGARRPPRGRRPGPPHQGPGAPHPGQPVEGGPPGEARPDSRGPRPPRHGGPPPRGRSGPPRQGGAPAHVSSGQPGGAQGPSEGSGPRPTPPPPPPPRKPRREPPRPKLTKEALEGKVPLRTFGELSALFAAKTPSPAPEKPNEPPPPVVSEPPASAPAEPRSEDPPPAV